MTYAFFAYEGFDPFGVSPIPSPERFPSFDGWKVGPSVTEDRSAGAHGTTVRAAVAHVARRHRRSALTGLKIRNPVAVQI